MAGGSNGAGGGPPKGSAWDSPHASPPLVLNDALEPRFGGTRIQPDALAHPAPSDPLASQSVDQTKLIYRQVPVVNVSTRWSIEAARDALASHMLGMFDPSAQLWDTLIANPRIRATLGSRVSGLFGEDVKFKAANDTPEALECLEAWKAAWPKFATSAALTGMHGSAIGMGFQAAQLLWDTSGDVWVPSIEPWHPRYTYYDYSLNRYMAISQDGSLPIVPGDGKWMLHAPFGAGVNARSWIWGVVRATTEPHIFRGFSQRDLARLSEVHGMPIRKGIVPAAGDPEQRDRFEQQLSNLGHETTIMVAKGVDGAGMDYDLELVEAKSDSSASMIALRDSSDMDIVLAIMFQNLTTEVTGGSFAAVKGHMDIRDIGVSADNQAWKHTIYQQAARPFAWLNFGDADLAPHTHWNVKPVAKWNAKGDLLTKFSTSIEVLRRGGVRFKTEKDLRRFARTYGVNLGRIVFKDPAPGGGTPAPPGGTVP